MKILRTLAIFFLLILSSCQSRQTVTLALLGDINLGRGVTPSSDSFAYLTGYLSAADLVLANLESPFGDDVIGPSSTYNLCAPANRVSFLVDWGLDLLSLANNHADDCTQGGVDATESVLAAAGLTGLTSAPVALEINGITLAFLAFNDISDTLDVEAAVQSIRDEHDSGALVVVSIHWGAEYQGAPSERQKALAGQFAEAGAALVWGHHPHVLQRLEGLQPQDRPAGSATLVLYSLGNALFDQGGLDDTRQSALVLVTLDVIGVADVEAIPFEIDVIHSRVVEPDTGTAEKIQNRVDIP